MKQKKKKSRVFGWVALGVLCLGMVVAALSLSNTVSDISERVISKTPDAILTSAGVSEDKLISVPVSYYDQRSDECVNIYDLSKKDALEARQFEWTSCEYHNKDVEQGLIEYELGEGLIPTAIKGKLVPNRGMDFMRWFSAVDEKSTNYAGVLEMQYRGNGAEFVFEAEEFYPLDGADFSEDDVVNKDGHNHLFTMSYAVPFTVLASGEEEFTVTADDDTFVFVGDKLAIDMGGIHDATTGGLVIHENGEVYAGYGDEDLAYTGIRVKEGDGSIVRIFHADRDSANSTFKMKFAGMNLNVTSTELAQGGNGIQVAYDPNDPTYVPPLGASSVFRPDSAKGLIIMVTIEAVMIVVASVLLVSVVRFVLKQKSQK